MSHARQFVFRSAFLTAFITSTLLGTGGRGQDTGESILPESDLVPEVAEPIEVEPTAEDVDIVARLTSILQATGWFKEPAAEVEEGVVFLEGRVDSEAHKEWAGRLAGNTQDVVAVVNRITVNNKPLWDLTPAWNALRELFADVVRSSPLALVGLVLASILISLQHPFKRRDLVEVAGHQGYVQRVNTISDALRRVPDQRGAGKVAA